MTAAKRKPRKQGAQNHTSMLTISVSADAIREARAAIVEILSVPNADNSTRVAALEALRGLCSVDGTTVSNCSFTTTT